MRKGNDCTVDGSMLPHTAVSVGSDASELITKGNQFKIKRGKLVYPFGDNAVAAEWYFIIPV